MEISFRPLNQCSSETLKGVARIHQAVMPTLLSDLGLPFVERYFLTAAKDPAVIGMAAVVDGGEAAVGYVIGSPQPARLMGKLTQPLPWFIIQLLRLLFTKPGTFFQLAASGLSIQNQMDNLPGAIEVSFLGIDPQARGVGLGERLMRAFLDACRGAGYRSVLLSVETENKAALAMHTKVGFRILKTFREGRFERHRMEILL